MLLVILLPRGWRWLADTVGVTCLREDVSKADKQAPFATGNLGCTCWGATVSLKQSRRGEVRTYSVSVKTTKVVLSTKASF